MARFEAEVASVSGAAGAGPPHEVLQAVHSSARRVLQAGLALQCVALCAGPKVWRLCASSTDDEALSRCDICKPCRSAGTPDRLRLTALVSRYGRHAAAAGAAGVDAAPAATVSAAAHGPHAGAHAARPAGAVASCGLGTAASVRGVCLGRARHTRGHRTWLAPATRQCRTARRRGGWLRAAAAAGRARARAAAVPARAATVHGAAGRAEHVLLCGPARGLTAASAERRRRAVRGSGKAVCRAGGQPGSAAFGSGRHVRRGDEEGCAGGPGRHEGARASPVV